MAVLKWRAAMPAGIGMVPGRCSVELPPMNRTLPDFRERSFFA
jgi:hypothetical protein